VADLLINTDLKLTGVDATVYTKTNITDEDWTERADLYCEWVEWCASPKLSGAQLFRRYGRGVLPGAGVAADVARLDVLRHWVKISIPQTTPGTADEYSDTAASSPLLWFGRIADVARESPQAGKPARQVWTVVGMEHILDFPVRESYCVGEIAADQRIRSGLEFNPPDHAKASATRPNSTGNRSPGTGPKSVYRFAGPNESDLEDAETWSTYEIVRYLLAYHAPEAGSGAPPIALAWHTTDAVAFLPDWDQPRVPTHNRTLRQVLDSVMDRRRGLSYVVEYSDDAPRTLTIRPFTFADSAVAMPSGAGSLAANSNTLQWDYEALRILSDATLETKAAEKVDRVRAVGANPLFILTLKATTSVITTTIIHNWDSTLETQYNDGAKDSAEYAALGTYDRAEKQRLHRDARAADELTRVYSFFGPDSGWPENDDSESWSNPLPEWLYALFDLDPDAGDRFFYRPMLRLERFLPLSIDTDYATGSTPVDNTPADLKWEYQRPIVVFKLKDSLPGASGKYQLADRLATAAAIEGTGDGGGREFSCSLHVRSDAAGFVLRVHGESQHAIAALDFGAGADDTDTYDGLPVYDWRDELIATFAIRADAPFERVYAPAVEASPNPVREMIVDASGRCEYHYLPSGTVVGVDDGGDLITSTVGTETVRDDSETLEDVARLAYEWYGRDRHALTATIIGAQNAAQFPLGYLVDQIGDPEATPATDEAIRTVITSVRVTFSDDAKKPHTTTVQTAWAELDPLLYLQ
jgi:hypothetical protein